MSRHKYPGFKRGQVGRFLIHMQERGKRRRYEFSSRWSLPGTVLSVFESLQDVGRYPEWWPQIRSVEQISEAEGLVRMRSFLPFVLVVKLSPILEDVDAGRLVAALEGDLEGTSEWEIREVGTNLVHADFQESVVLRKDSMRSFGYVARPLLIANHAWMMRSGEQGLRRRISSLPKA